MTLISHDRHCFILDCGTSGVISQKNTLLSEHNVRITSIEECRLLCPGFEAVQPEKSANFISTRKTLICRRVKIRTPYIERCPQLTFYSPVCSQYIYNWNTQISLCPQCPTMQYYVRVHMCQIWGQICLKQPACPQRVHSWSMHSPRYVIVWNVARI